MRPDDTSAIDETLPCFRMEFCGSKGLGLKIFHKKVCDNVGERGAHRNTTNLFIELTLETKESRGEAKANQPSSVFISDTINDINGFLDGDSGV